ncbi:Hypothetical_protein [Hexamita inflata]|uniref:Hypothetical_protein n=1 Tax=Hexamita inflata TaxID=28002 RepID=A0AA86TIT5_9EUKA|nr:Hypothetical protein HINF_LOCUS6166 [Hexamita inflata]CAI9957812.1 Hypothetical protein HINF_LOCUS45457 [Hexamita inflata]
MQHPDAINVFNVNIDDMYNSHAIKLKQLYHKKELKIKPENSTKLNFSQLASVQLDQIQKIVKSTQPSRQLVTTPTKKYKSIQQLELQSNNVDKSKSNKIQIKSNYKFLTKQLQNLRTYHSPLHQSNFDQIIQESTRMKRSIKVSQSNTRASTQGIKDKDSLEIFLRVQ